jgi:hypothetical protein
MTKANDLASLLDANGDVVASALDNVPASNDASALTTGTLDAARLPASGVDASSLTLGTLPDARFPAVLPAVSGANLTNLPPSGITDVVADTTPQLGGNLDLNSNDITGTGNINITGSVTATSFTGDGSALTGLPSGDVVDDTTPQLGGDLQSNGNDIVFADNDRATFGNGTGGDLRIYHDAVNSYIYESGTGDLKISTNGGNIRLQKTLTEIMADFKIDSSVDLYYNNSKKLATTNTGVDVTGTVAATTIAADTLTHSSAGSIATNYVVEGSAKTWIAVTIAAAIDSSLNISSVTDTSTGEFDPQLTSSMSDALYCSNTGVDLTGHVTRGAATEARTTSSLKLISYQTHSAAASENSIDSIHSTSFGDLA